MRALSWKFPLRPGSRHFDVEHAPVTRVELRNPARRQPSRLLRPAPRTSVLPRIPSGRARCSWRWPWHGCRLPLGCSPCQRIRRVRQALRRRAPAVEGAFELAGLGRRLGPGRWRRCRGRRWRRQLRGRGRSNEGGCTICRGPRQRTGSRSPPYCREPVWARACAMARMDGEGWE